MGLSSLNDEKSFSPGCDGTHFSCLLCSYSKPATHNKRQEHQCSIWFYKYLSRPYQYSEAISHGHCFDTAAPTERHTDFEDYKANRQDAPEDILTAIPDIRKIIKGFNIPILELDGYEADDVLGTLCKQGEKAGYEVYMVTPDKDF